MSTASVSVAVPTTGDGVAADISTLVGEKTVQLSGTFTGSYDLLVTHNDVDYAPVLTFNSSGPEGLKQTLPGAFKSAKLRSNAVASGTVTCEVSSVVGATENYFATVATLAVGQTGYTAVVDTESIFPSGLEDDICFLCRGGFRGSVDVLGSSDGAAFNPLGAFRVDRVPEGSPASFDFPVLPTLDKVRYLRLHLNGEATASTVVTVGGRIPASSGPSPSSAVAAAAACSASGRQTTLNASGEEILYEELVDVSGGGTTLTPRLSLTAHVTGGTGTYRLYVGATAPGDTTGATLRATATTVSTTPAKVTAAGAAFANPSGQILVQVTGQNDLPAAHVSKTGSFSVSLN